MRRANDFLMCVWLGAMVALDLLKPSRPEYRLPARAQTLAR